MICPSCLSFILYNPIRKLFTDRDNVLEQAGIKNDTVVLEIGAGNGFFTEAIAGRAKKVYAVEIQEGMVRKLLKRINTLDDRDKIEVIHKDIAHAELPDGLADIAFLYYSFHEITDKEKAAQTIARAVRRGGKVCIFEPTIEVSKRKMEYTLKIFESIGLKKEAEALTIFTRFARLGKP